MSDKPLAEDAVFGQAVIVAVLAEHEARWTTHGWERTYQVMHCVGDCDWKLRQKALMTDDYCYEKHREHVAERIAAALNPPPPPPALGTPQNPVDGRAHPCPTPGYRGHHTAVGAGAISSPYVCHGCSTWFVLPEEGADRAE